MSRQVLFIDKDDDLVHVWRVCVGREREPSVLDMQSVHPLDRCTMCWSWLERAVQRGEA